MSAAQHTPGPWKRTSETMIHGGSSYVARIQRGPLPPDEVTANARLICAAPDLLAALNHIAYELIGELEANAAHVLNEVVRIARAAIARAKGVGQ